MSSINIPMCLKPKKQRTLHFPPCLFCNNLISSFQKEKKTVKKKTTIKFSFKLKALDKLEMGLSYNQNRSIVRILSYAVSIITAYCCSKGYNPGASDVTQGVDSDQGPQFADKLTDLILLHSANVGFMF